MRPKQFLKEAVEELEAMYKHSIISAREYNSRREMVAERYSQKQELRDGWRKR